MLPVKMIIMEQFMYMGWFGLLRVTPQQQPGSHRGGDDDDDEMSVSLVEEIGVPSFV